MAGVKKSVNPLTHSVGLNTRLVTVTAITPDNIAICVDRTGVEVRVPLLFQRAKGQLPAVGENWLISQDFGRWAFQAFLGGTPGDFASAAVTQGAIISPNAPSSPVVGDIWINSLTGVWSVWDGTQWNATSAAGGAVISNTAPANPSIGMLWVDTTNGNLINIWDGSQWVAAPIGSNAIEAGAIVAGLVAAGAIDGQTINAVTINGGQITGAQFITSGTSGAYFVYSSGGNVTNTFTSSGSWTAPAGVTSVVAEAWGGGGGGGAGGGGSAPTAPAPVFGMDAQAPWSSVKSALGVTSIAGWRAYNGPGLPSSYPGADAPIQSGVTTPVVSYKPALPISSTDQAKLASLFASSPSGSMTTIWHEGEASGYSASTIKAAHALAYSIFRANAPADALYGQILMTYTAYTGSSHYPLGQWVATQTNGHPLDFYAADWYPSTPNDSSATVAISAWYTQLTGVIASPVIAITECNYTTDIQAGIVWKKTTVASGSNGGTISQIATWGSGFGGNGHLLVASTANYASSGTIWVACSGSTVAVVNYTGKTTTSFTGCTYVSGSSSGTVSTGSNILTPESLQAQWFTDAWAWAKTNNAITFLPYYFGGHGVPWPPSNAAISELSTIISQSAPALGSGGGGGSGTSAGGGGGGGEYASQTLAVTPGNSYSYTVGAAGTAGVSGGNSFITGNAATLTAHGGLHGTTAAGGSGGTGSTNTTHFPGGSGAGSISGTLVTQSFTSSGSWTAPSGVTTIQVECWGGGGGGMGGQPGSINTINSGYGGGGGAYSKVSTFTVTPGNSYSFTVGGGGASGNIGGFGGNGGSSNFNSGTCIAVGGSASTGSTAPGGLFSNCVGDSRHSGGNSGTVGGQGGSGGGGSGGTSSAGNNGGNSGSNDLGAAGGSAVAGGGGGGGGGNNGSNGSPGGAPGGGGGGAGQNGLGGAGAKGKVTITYTAISGGGGGGSGGTAAAGQSATTASGATSVSGGGPGGSGKVAATGLAPIVGPGGGGGGGGTTNTGGPGFKGQIRITYNSGAPALTGSIAGAAGTDPFSNTAYPEGASFDNLIATNGTITNLTSTTSKISTLTATTYQTWDPSAIGTTVEAPHAFTFANSWSQAAGRVATQYILLGNGLVLVMGSVIVPTGFTPGQAITTAVPAAYRPTHGPSLTGWDVTQSIVVRCVFTSGGVLQFNGPGASVVVGDTIDIAPQIVFLNS